MKVLLTTINSKYIHQNLAIRWLYELNRSYPGLHVKEFALKMDTEEIVTHCCAFQMVAFSCYIWNIERTLEVAAKIKQQNPQCVILLGGPEVSYEWADLMERSEVDLIIPDEGEVPFARLLQNYPTLETVPGLIWKKNGKVVQNTAPELFDLTGLDGINPYIHIPDEELKNKIGYIEATRGCPNRCEYCLAGLQNKVRYLPEATVQSNLLYLMQRGKTIKFLDRTFNTNPAYAISIFRFILEHHRPQNIFQFEVKADILQWDLIEFVQTQVPKGIFRFEIGIQTLNEQSNQEVNRKLDFANIKKFVERVSGKIEIHLDLIVGLPNDYWDDIKFSFEEVFKLYAPELQLGFLKFLKGTPLRQNYQAHGYRFQATPPYQIIESKYLSADELEQISLVEHALDMYWNKKKAVDTLKYVTAHYSIFDFLLGLGQYYLEHQTSAKKELSEVYTLMFDFVDIHYPNDTVLIELIALDYYRQYKVKPRVRFLPEAPATTTREELEKRNLNPHKYRYIIHPVHFSVQTYIDEGTITPAVDYLVLEFTGIHSPRIIPDIR